MEKVNAIALLNKDRFAQHCGIELLEVSGGHATVQMTILPEHLNGVGIVHGGVIFTLADFAFAAASNSHEQIAVGINANISYLKSTAKGVLKAKAEEVSATTRLATYLVHVTDDNNDVVALFQGTVYKKRIPRDSLPVTKNMPPDESEDLQGSN